VEVWERASARHPELRGAMAWSIDLDRTIDYRFAQQMSAVSPGGDGGSTGAGDGSDAADTGPTPAPGVFRDVPDGVHFTAIERMADAGVVRGYGDGTFRPRVLVTRGQVASVLSRSLELTAADCAADCDRLSDVDGSTHAEGIRALVAAGAIDGFPDGTFRPGQEVTRAQFASMLANAFDYPLNATSAGFDDVTGSRHEPAIAALVDAGVTTGRTTTSFAPRDPVQRDQLASFLDRALADG